MTIDVLEMFLNCVLNRLHPLILSGGMQGFVFVCAGFSKRLHPLMLSGGLQGFVFVFVFVLSNSLHPLIVSGGLQGFVFFIR